MMAVHWTERSAVESVVLKVARKEKRMADHLVCSLEAKSHFLKLGQVAEKLLPILK